VGCYYAIVNGWDLEVRMKGEISDVPGGFIMRRTHIDWND